MPNPDIEPCEQAALTYAGTMAGEYLESVGKTDLTQLSPNEWQIFLEVVCHNYHQKLNELTPCPF